MKQYWPKICKLVSFAAAKASNFEVRSRIELASLGVITPDTYIDFLVAEAHRMAATGSIPPLDTHPVPYDMSV